MSWNYTDIYVAACLRPFTTHREGRSHERECPECQAIIRGDQFDPLYDPPEDQPEEDGDA